MPTYQYKCPKCGHEYEKLQKITDDSRAKCPKCGTRGERVISAGAGLIFKGSGFYATDYQKKGGGESEGAKADKEGAKADKADKADKGDKPTEKPVETSADKPKKKPGADS